METLRGILIFNWSNGVNSQLWVTVSHFFLLTEHFNDFDKTIIDDARISELHINLYMALLLTFEPQIRLNPVAVHKAVKMRQAKIKENSRYHTAMRDLQRLGYI